MHLRTCISWLIALGLTASTPTLAADPERAALAAVEEQVQALGGEEHVEADLLEIKFHDDQLIRLRNGVPTDLSGRGLRTSQAALLMKAVEGGEWMRSHEVSEEALEKLQSEGQRLTAARLPDLNLYFRVRLPKVLDANRIAAAFHQLPEVEAVYRVPRPVDPPVAPDYYSVGPSSYQKYQDEAPAGIDARYAHGVPGGNGASVKVCDVEYSFNTAHVDLGPVTIIGPTGVDPFNNTNHGTAVLGVIGSQPNGEGTLGIAPAVQKLFSPANTSSGYNVGAAVTTCAANLGFGDVIVIEQQLGGPNGSTAYVPSEWYKPWYNAIRLAVAANKVVVAAAGNGSQDLDSPIYSTGNGGHYPFLPGNDSGAIIVGAGKSPAYGTAARSAHNFSNYGSTVDLQAWGDSITSAGYGNLYSTDGVNRWYTSSFSGTSGATAIMGGVVASLQGAAIASGRGALSNITVLDILSLTGTPQGSDPRHIGPLPNLRKALWDVPIVWPWASTELNVRPADAVGAQAFSTAIGAGHGMYLVVWSEASSSPPDIWGVRVRASDGALLDTSPIPVATSPNPQFRPAVAFDGTNFLVVWEEIAGLPTIYGTRVRALDGAVLDTPFLISRTDTGGLRVPQSTPAVAFDAASSNYLVTWNSVFSDGESIYSGIQGIRVRASDGAVLETKSFPLSRGGADSRVAAAGGSFLVAWTKNQGAQGNNIEAVRVSGATGGVMDATPLSVAATAANEFNPAVASRAGGLAGEDEFLVVWTGAGNTLWGRRLRASDGATLDASEFVVGTAAVTPASVTFDGQDYRVVWQGTREGVRKLLSTRVSSAGVVAPGAEFALAEVSPSATVIRADLAATSVGRFVASYLQYQPAAGLQRARLRLATDGAAPCESLDPLLVLNGRAVSTLECGPGTYSDPGARAFDGCGNPIPVHAYNTGTDSSGPGPLLGYEGSYTVSYAAWDSQGRTVNAARTVNVDDRTAATLSLLGPASMTHTCGSQWQDPGVQALDACYGDISTWGWHEGEVNGWAAGTYTVRYFMADGAGNVSAPVTRTVEVVDCPW